MHQYRTRLGALVRDFSACFGYFTKWDRNYFEISWDHFEFQSWCYSRNKWRIFIHGRAETRNFSSSVEKHSTGERFELLHMKCMMGSSRNAWSFSARRTAHLPSFCQLPGQLPGQLHSWFQWYPTILTPSLWTGLWSSEELGRAGTFSFPSLAIFFPNREPVHRLSYAMSV